MGGDRDARHARRRPMRAARRSRARMDRLLGPDDVLCLPTSPRAAPLLGTPVDKIEIEYRNQAMCLLCIAGLAGLPQLSMPMATIDGLPLGLSIVGRQGTDTMLLALAKRVETDGGWAEATARRAQ